MDRFKEFLRTKGLYIAIGTGVLAFVGLMVIYNYNTKWWTKSEARGLLRFP